MAFFCLVYVHTVWSDFGVEMAKVQGVVVARRPGLANSSHSITPAHTLDFVPTLKSYFAIFKASLLPRYGMKPCSIVYMSRGGDMSGHPVCVPEGFKC